MDQAHVSDRMIRAGSPSKCWANFDAWSDKLVAREVTFAQFAAATTNDVARIARVSSRRKAPPSWWSIEDVKGEVLTLLWFYAMERVDSLGNVGFDGKKYRAAGAWLRWKVTHKLAKRISQARHENQHSRRGPAAPEYLSKTGELPDVGEESSAEALCDRSRQREKLKKLAKTAKEFVMLDAITRGGNDEIRIVAYLIESKVYDDPEVAHRAVNAFVSEFSKKHAPRGRSAVLAA